MLTRLPSDEGQKKRTSNAGPAWTYHHHAELKMENDIAARGFSSEIVVVAGLIIVGVWSS